MRRVLLALAFLLGAFGCQDDPFIPEGTTRIPAPPEYRVWWEDSRPCVHRREFRTFEDIRWYISPTALVSEQGVKAAALTDGRDIYIQAMYQSVPWVIQHELVHAINGVQGHPDDPFLTCNLMAWH